MASLTKFALASILALTVCAHDGHDVSSTSAPTKTSSIEAHVVTAIYPDIADGDVNVSVIGADNTATTYLACDGEVADDEVANCGYNYTIYAGPSTAGLYLSVDGYLMDIRCELTTTASAASCSAHNSDASTEVQTSTVFTDLDSFRTNITVTAGYEKIASATATPTGAETGSRTGSSSSSTTTGSASSSNTGGDGSAAPGRLHGAAMAGVAAVIGGLVML